MRILLIKLGAIGDVIMAIPAAYALHLRGYQVDWVCGNGIAPILRLYPWINVLALDERPLLTGNLPTRLRALVQLWRLLANRATYELCATLYYDRRSRLLTLPVRARKRLHLSTTDRNARLVPGRHHTSEYLRLLDHALTGAPDDQAPHKLPPVPLDPASLPLVAIQLPNLELRTSHLAPQTCILLPAGARNLLRDDILRRWPIEHYVALADLLLARGHSVHLAGGPGDDWASAHFAHLPVTDHIGKLSLPQSLALFDAAALVITHDTGPLHMAGLTRAAILALFGPTDPHVFLPARPNTTALWGGEGFACRPCHDGRDFAPCTHNGCLHQITPTFALAEAEALLSARQTNTPQPPKILTPIPTALVNLNL